MKKTIFCALIVFLCIGFFPASGLSTPISVSEARNVAENWIRYIIYHKGRWGNSRYATVASVKEFKRKHRLLGYICDVDPAGCIVVPNTRELSPVRFFSVRSRLDPESDEGMVALVKDRLERYLSWIEKSPGLARKRYCRKRINRYKESWERLTASAESFQNDMESETAPADYEEGEQLLITYWHQREPYNDQCPDMGCSWTCNTNTNALVGCLATAGSQIFRYWGWPPYGIGEPYSDPYDWPNMPTCFSTESCVWDPVKVDAVAELCHEVGIAFNLTYGCDGTGGTVYFSAILPNFRYSGDAVIKRRVDYPDTEVWENIIISELRKRRPIQYLIPGHAIIVDGWMTDLGSNLFHINYGHGFTSNTGWFAIDDIPGGDETNEAMVMQVYPDCSLGATLSGSYVLQSFPYRYFDQDATGTAATFQAGQKLQFLRNVVVQCDTNPGSYIVFNGSGSSPTLLFSDGNQARGIKLHGDGSRMVLHRGGSIRFW